MSASGRQYMPVSGRQPMSRTGRQDMSPPANHIPAPLRQQSTAGDAQATFRLGAQVNDSDIEVFGKSLQAAHSTGIAPSNTWTEGHSRFAWRAPCQWVGPPNLCLYVSQTQCCKGTVLCAVI